MKRQGFTNLARALLLASTALLPHSAAMAAEVNAAVAANFTAAMKEIVTAFEAATGHKVLASYGSTGKLYAQIVNGAPFGLFLAADAARPKRLEEEGKAVPGSRFTYAVGRLVLWSPAPDRVDGEGTVLKSGEFSRLAIANPKTAPYGTAAMEVLEGLGLEAAVSDRLIRGDSITQTYQFVASGNAELGFVALSQVALLPEEKVGSRWLVPQSLYAPLQQQAVLLKEGAGNPAAVALAEYLKSPAARAVIEAYGYGTE
ncbi:molybdate ABC transporter substrate-binding protein [Thioalbus denitrificans]|uniref:Molybdate transport system substrate-binding protein n=1 Tax=Thioalbus denitrificans TaxID=547122 RepID=A0A369CH84_9GAMM|nr:molybdate ABC transporter substrate-binding protein [Thioalbus denitrificans]RCX32046.1 molybdate transport system substrate-binding protein [Thioalbus denitrificans]